MDAPLPMAPAACPDWAHPAVPAQSRYQPRRPERTILYQVVAEHMETLFAEAEAASPDGVGYPAYVRREFERFLSCGLWSEGFARVRCGSCGHERLLPFSCKSRALCPSCIGRRMADGAAHLVDHVLPRAPYRLWTLSLPHRIRLLVVRNPPLLSRVLSLFLRAVFAWQRRRARKQGIAKPLTGAVTMLQFWGSILQLTPHAHSWLPDGVFEAHDQGVLRFHRIEPPADAEVAAILARVERKVLAACDAADETLPDDDEQVVAQAQLEASRPALFTLPLTEKELGPRPRCALRNGFSLHANLDVHQKNRNTLERLLRYGMRPPFAQNRLSLLQDGRVRLELRKPFYTGQTDVIFEPVQFLRRLAAAIPKPRQNLLRFHGIFAANAKHRDALKRLVPQPRPRTDTGQKHHGQKVVTAPDADEPTSPQNQQTTPAYRRTWAELHARIFGSDLTACPRCSGPMKVIQFVKDPDVIHKVCRHLGLPTTLPPVAPARAPPELSFDLDL